MTSTGGLTAGLVLEDHQQDIHCMGISMTYTGGSSAGRLLEDHQLDRTSTG